MKINNKNLSNYQSQIVYVCGLNITLLGEVKVKLEPISVIVKGVHPSYLETACCSVIWTDNSYSVFTTMEETIKDFEIKKLKYLKLLETQIEKLNIVSNKLK